MTILQLLSGVRELKSQGSRRIVPLDAVGRPWLACGLTKVSAPHMSERGSGGNGPHGFHVDTVLALL
jgi:hypothetical protein